MTDQPALAQASNESDTISRINDLVEQLAGVRFKIDEYLAAIALKTEEEQAAMSVLREMETDLKDAIKELMLPLSVERLRHFGLLLTAVSSVDFELTNMSDAKKFLIEEGQRRGENLLPRYLTLDAKKVIKDFPAAPGVERKESKYIRIGADRKGQS